MKITIENTFPKHGNQSEHTFKWTYEDDSWELSRDTIEEAVKGILRALGFKIEDDVAE